MKSLTLLLFTLLFSSLTVALGLPQFSSRNDLCTISDKSMNEISGIAPSLKNAGIFWVHNDSDNDAFIYGISISCSVVCVLKIENTSHTDWEDICTGKGPDSSKNYIYIGDIGDNNSVRTVKSIIRIEEPDLSNLEKVDTLIYSNPDVLYFTFPDAVHDCEALMIDNLKRDLILVSKRLNNEKVYCFPYPQRLSDTTELEFLCELPFGNEGFTSSGVTCGDISQDGTEILMKTYGSVYYYQRSQNESIKDALSKQAQQVSVYSMEPQGEGICWSPSADAFYTISEESPFKITPHLYSYQKKNSEIIDSNSVLFGFSVSLNRETKCLSINGISSDNSFIRIYNMKGKVVLSLELEQGNNKMNLEELNRGVYIYRIHDGKDTFKGKINLD